MKRPNRELPKIVEQGFKAFMDGKDSTINPYPRHSDEHKSWRRGYANATYGQMLSEKYGKG